jgi:uncharacterized protein YigE (DUF2233 family)
LSILAILKSRAAGLSRKAGFLRFVLSLSFVAATDAALADCGAVTQDARRYTVCKFDPRKDDIRTFWLGPNGAPLNSFSSAAAALKPGEKLVFAMNGGMYDANDAPVGLYIEKAQEMRRANTRNGAGNFHLKPNGVFYVGGGRAGVVETSHFLKERPAADYATQSGPLLVIGGKIHPRIQADGVSEKSRNGVGIDREGMAVFAISEQPVTFYTFASLFRDALHCDNALFLDGSISALYAPDLGRDDFTLPLGPMIGVVVKSN